MRIQSPLPEELEALVSRVIGVGIAVHELKGAGYKEDHYEDSMCIELQLNGLTFQRQDRVAVEYRGKPLSPLVLDLIVEKQVVVEVKAVEQLLPVHVSQVVSYLRATNLRIGLLMNFNAAVLKVKRVVV